MAIKLRFGLRQYNLITSFDEIEGKQFPNWHHGVFFAKDRKELKLLLAFIKKEYKEENIGVLIDEVDASDIIGELGHILRKFNIRDN